jgi:hypothetical protein
VDIWNRISAEARQFYLTFIDRELSNGELVEDTGLYLASCVQVPSEPAYKGDGDDYLCLVTHEILAPSVELLDSTKYCELVCERVKNKTGINILLNFRKP